MCLWKGDVQENDSLMRPLSLETVLSSLWSDKCDYVQAEECNNLNPNNYNFVVLQWNIRSILSNLSELKLLLTKLENKNTLVDILLLCETFPSEKTTKWVKIPNYTYY